VAESIGGTGADRCDHGLDAAERPELITLTKNKSVGMTLCPWAYVRHHPETNIFGHIRTLFDAGVKFSIGSDSPAYVEDHWITHNLILLRLKGRFTDSEIVRVQKNAVEICWTDEGTKKRILKEIDKFVTSRA
jgi:adenosine deaminase